MRYINTKYNGYVETVDEFETVKESKAMLTEYNLASPEMGYYASSRCSKDWKQ